MVERVRTLLGRMRVVSQRVRTLLGRMRVMLQRVRTRLRRMRVRLQRVRTRLIKGERDICVGEGREIRNEVVEGMVYIDMCIRPK
jgi:hypothetical protein